MSERSLNRVFAVNLLAWAVLSCFAGPVEERYCVVRLCIAALHLMAACLFWIREPLREESDYSQWLICLPSIVMSGLMLSFSPSFVQWPVYSNAIFLGGTLLTLLSLSTLGKSFSILPARRTIRQHGAYSIVRHPVYASELVLLAACWTAAIGSWKLSVAFCASVVLCVLRIGVEERLLRSDPDYRGYCERVLWRLVPFVW